MEYIFCPINLRINKAVITDLTFHFKTVLNVLFSLMSMTTIPYLSFFLSNQFYD